MRRTWVSGYGSVNQAPVRTKTYRLSARGEPGLTTGGGEAGHGRCRACGYVSERSLAGVVLLVACAPSVAGDTSGDRPPDGDKPRPAGLASQIGLWKCTDCGVAGEVGAEGWGLRKEASASGLLGLVSSWPRRRCGLLCMRCLNCLRLARMPVQAWEGTASSTQVCAST